MEKAAHRWDWRWLSWALMSSHVHHGLLAGEDDPDRFFRSAHTRYAQAFHAHRADETLGPVFADRPALYAVDRSDLPRLVVYHHRNPVTAGVVARPRDSTWTSHRVYLRLDPAPPWFDVEWALDVLGFRDTDAGRRQFDEFVNEVDLHDRPPSEPTALARAYTSAATSSDLTQLLAVARDVARMPPHEPLDTRSRRAALARKLIIIIGTRDLRHRQAAIGRELGIREGSVSNILARSSSMELEGCVAEVRRRLSISPKSG
jgi:hypothetical protein